jgi:hypothetical protein
MLVYEGGASATCSSSYSRRSASVRGLSAARYLSLGREGRHQRRPSPAVAQPPRGLMARLHSLALLTHRAKSQTSPIRASASKPQTKLDGLAPQYHRGARAGRCSSRKEVPAPCLSSSLANRWDAKSGILLSQLSAVPKSAQCACTRLYGRGLLAQDSLLAACLKARP